MESSNLNDNNKDHNIGDTNLNNNIEREKKDYNNIKIDINMECYKENNGNCMDIVVEKNGNDEEYSEYTNEDEEGEEEEEEDIYEEDDSYGDQEYCDERYLDENEYNNGLSFRNNPKLTTSQINSNKQYSNISGKIFVGGLLKTTSNETLRDYFTQFGNVKESIVIKATEKANKSRGFGFVTFIEPSTIEKVMLLEHLIESKRVEIRKAIPKEEMMDEPKKQKLFVGGLPKHITLDEFKSYFSDYGEVLECNLLVEKNGIVKGFGFICFKDENVNHIVLSDTHFILGKRVDVRVADNQHKRFQQTNNPHPHYQYPIASHQKANLFFLQAPQSHSNLIQQLASSPSSSSSNQQSIIPSPPLNIPSSPPYPAPYNISPVQQQYENNNNNPNIKSIHINNTNNNNNNVHQKHLINSPQQHPQNTISGFNQPNSHPFHLHPIQIKPDSNGSYELYHNGYESFYAPINQHQNTSSTSFYPGNVVMVPVIYPYPYQQDPSSSKYYQQSMHPYYNRYYPHARVFNLTYPNQYDSQQVTSGCNQHTFRLPKQNNHNHNKNINNIGDNQNNNSDIINHDINQNTN